MKIYLGETGLDKTWQEKFSKTVKCHKCKGNAKIMFIGYERGEENKCVCDLHKTTGEEGGLWLHDACAIAIYLCPKCFEVTAKLNQA